MIIDADQEHWPSESEWMARLPEWFVAAFADPKVLSREDAWDFGSWLYSLEERIPVWWSSQSIGEGWVIKVALPEWPHTVGALKWLASMASDFSPVEVIENEAIPVIVRGAGGDPELKLNGPKYRTRTIWIRRGR